jgi:hypothetical protein
MAIGLSVVLSFIASWIVSSVIIYIVTKFFFKQKEGIGTAFLAALVGAIVYSAVSLILGIGLLSTANTIIGNGLLAALFGGIAWLIALGSLYKIGWAKAFVIAIIIWFCTYIVGFVLPTLTGPV